jgi:hypothetical protein
LPTVRFDRSMQVQWGGGGSSRFARLVSFPGTSMKSVPMLACIHGIRSEGDYTFRSRLAFMIFDWRVIIHSEAGLHSRLDGIRPVGGGTRRRKKRVLRWLTACLSFVWPGRVASDDGRERCVHIREAWNGGMHLPVLIQGHALGHAAKVVPLGRRRGMSASFSQARDTRPKQALPPPHGQASHCHTGRQLF